MPLFQSGVVYRAFVANHNVFGQKFCANHRHQCVTKSIWYHDDDIAKMDLMLSSA